MAKARKTKVFMLKVPVFYFGKKSIALSAGALEYTACFSAER